jgi:hypothetical protein
LKSPFLLEITTKVRAAHITTLLHHFTLSDRFKILRNNKKNRGEENRKKIVNEGDRSILIGSFTCVESGSQTGE